MDDVIVLGGGVVGASAAYRLARVGARVLLVDADLEGAATAAGAGIISPGTAMARNDDVPPGFLSLAFRAGSYYVAMLEQLAEDGETNTGFGVVGCLTVAADAAEASRMPVVLARMEQRRAAGVALIGRVAWVDAVQTRDLFPLLTERMQSGAIYASGAARVDGRLLLGALRRAADRRGARTLQGLAEVVTDNHRALGVRVNGELRGAGAILIAAGSWTGILVQRLGFSVPIEPERGQIAHFRLADTDVGHWPTIVGFADTGYMVGFAGNRLVAGATREPGSGFDPRLTAAGVHEVLSSALRLAPGLGNATLLEVRVGLRPVARDHLPVLGRIPGLENAYVCAGHGHLGLLMGPYSGAAMADVIRGAKPDLDLAPYAPDRFARAPVD